MDSTFSTNTVPRPILSFRKADAPKGRATKQYINYLNKTEGELTLRLLMDRLQIVKQYYGDQEGLYTVAENMINQAARGGLHNLGSAVFTGVYPQELQGIAAVIKKASKQTRLNTGLKTPSISGPFDPFGDEVLINASGSCDSIRNNLTDLLNQINSGQSGVPVSTLQNQANNVEQQLRLCEEKIPLLNILNERLEESSHDLIYAYLSNQDIIDYTTNGFVNTKRAFHQTYIDKMALITGASKNNMKVWIENGIMRQNVVKGAEPLEGRLTALGFGYNNLENRSINGFPFAAVIAAVAAIVQAVLSAVVAMKQMNNEFPVDKRAQLINNIPPPGFPSFDPLSDDWLGNNLPPGSIIDPGGTGGEGSNGGDGFQSTSNSGLLLGLAGVLIAGGLIVGNQDK